MKEAAFQQQVLEAARHLGWRTAHFRPAQNGRGQWRTPVAGDGKGFPDLVLVRDRIIFAELKTDIGKLREEQEAWLNALGYVSTEVSANDRHARGLVRTVIWRPRDWDEIIETLKGAA